MSRLAVVARIVAVCLVAASVLGPLARHPLSATVTPAAAPAAAPTAHHDAGTPRVGAIFSPGTFPVHDCSGSVVRSHNRDVVMTAAHCITGTGRGYSFAPGYHDGRMPYGLWRVTAVYGTPGWLRHGDTHRDYAFLVTAARTVDGRTQQLQDVTGANHLGHTPHPGQRVTVRGYGAGSLDAPLACTVPVYRHMGYPAFDCGGFVGGTSGSPWLRGHGAHRSVDGVIGGLHQGGCSASTSYSSPVTRAAHIALRRAGHHARADTFPAPPGDGC